MINVEELMTVREAAKRLSVSKPHVYNLMLRRELPYVQIGRSRRIPAEALDAFIREHLHGIDCE